MKMKVSIFSEGLPTLNLSSPNTCLCCTRRQHQQIQISMTPYIRGHSKNAFMVIELPPIYDSLNQCRVVLNYKHLFSYPNFPL